MDRTEAEQFVKAHLEDYLQQKGINTRRPFRCLNPAHTDNKPSMSVNRNAKDFPRCHCFSCGANYSTFDVIAIDYSLTETRDIFSKGYEIFGLEVEGYKRTGTKPMLKKYDAGSRIEDLKKTPKVDFTDAVEAAHKELLQNQDALEGLQKRGITLDTIKKYKIGYDAAGYNHFLKDHPRNKSKSEKEVLYHYVFPYPNKEGRFTYFMMEISDRTQIDRYNGKYRKPTHGDTGIAAELFNERYIVQPPADVIFITEGPYDALSVEEAGQYAIALGGIGHERFKKLCNAYRPDVTFVISLDKDGAGADATPRITETLERLDIPYRIQGSDAGKDFNDALQADRGAFTEFINTTVEDIRQEAAASANAEKEAYMQTSAAGYLQGFIDDIVKSKKAVYYPTGFPELDSILDGGLFSGLYILGGVTSLGKTSFVLQIMDNIAAAGYDVLMFSLEMARQELISKSVSRHSLQEDLQRYNSTRHAKTTRGITNGKLYEKYSKKDMDVISAAISAYSKYADHIYIHEGVGNIGVNQITDTVGQHIKITGNKPVVFVDYLQILAPYNDRYTDKQNTDKNVLELKRLSRDLKIPVFAISSFNRSNYTEPVNNASFKESGAVEYSSDVLIGLQYEGMDYQEGEEEKKRNKRVRKLLKEQAQKAKKGKTQSIQVKVLKNRNGAKGEALLDYDVRFNYFTESQKSGTAQEEENLEDVEDLEEI